MNESYNVVRENNTNVDEELVDVGEVGVLERLHMHAKEVLKRDESSSARCKYPDHVKLLCKHIGSREKIKTTKVYPSLVKIGYGIKYAERKNGISAMFDIIESFDRMRSSDEYNDRILEGIVSGVISFDGESKAFRYDNNFIAEMSDYAEQMNIHASDLYLYFCMIGLDDVCGLDEYKHLGSDMGRVKAAFDMKKTETNLKFVTLFINDFYNRK